MKILITGANGFIGKNLRTHLIERKDVEVVCFTSENDIEQLALLLSGVTLIYHLAGVNRSADPNDFFLYNEELTRLLCCQVVIAANRTNTPPATIVYASSTQAANSSPYGQSKRGAELILLAASEDHGIPVNIFRLPNVFGKWCQPNYNSFVATFCHNIARGLPIKIDNGEASVKLIFIEDLINQFIDQLDALPSYSDLYNFRFISQEYTCTVGEIARLIESFKRSRITSEVERVGAGFIGALYSTYISYLPVESFSYPVHPYDDARGMFVEILKTPDCGQFSFFTAFPGVTRGGHYHHTKTEKFLVIRGQARFRFRHIQTGEKYELLSSGAALEIVETIPGWTHDITNIGVEELFVMLWANEVFDRSKPDTFNCPV